MAYQKRNIIIGAADLYIGVGDSTQANYAAPAVPAPAAGAGGFRAALEAAAAWRHVGFTSEGLELAYEPDWGEVEVDQLLDSAKTFKQSMRVTLNTTLTEATLENLLVAWGQQNASLGAAGSDQTIGIAAGALGDEPVERSVAAIGPAPRNAANEKRERLYHGRRALSVESTTIALRRNEATVFPVSFRLLPDAAFPGQEYGVIRDRVIA